VKLVAKGPVSPEAEELGREIQAVFEDTGELTPAQARWCAEEWVREGATREQVLPIVAENRRTPQEAADHRARLFRAGDPESIGRQG
jgi:hypothetical protein